jgi:glucose-1-phosphate cytidylyltransferase
MQDTRETSVKDIPVLILAGGLGTRLSEETSLKPKPMVEVGGIPILVHVMRYYYQFGFEDFVICAGHLSHVIKDYFANYELQFSHIEIDHRQSMNTRPHFFSGGAENQERWRVRVLETGANAMTGSRIARALDTLEKIDGALPQTFAVTYGDGLTNCHLIDELSFHRSHKKIGTVLGVKPTARFGELDADEKGVVQGFLEKPESRQGFINGGFFFFEKGFRQYLQSADSCILERAPLEKLSQDGQFVMYPHSGFWQCMDNLRDKMLLEKLWSSPDCPWMLR